MYSGMRYTQRYVICSQGYVRNLGVPRGMLGVLRDMLCVLRGMLNAYIPKVIFPQVMDLWLLEIPISRREAPMAEVTKLFVHYIPPRGTFGNKE